MPSKTINRHREIANSQEGLGQGVRLSLDTIAEIMTYREALFLCAPSHQGGHSGTGAAIAEALGVAFPLTVPSLEAAAKAERLDTDGLWPWLAKQRAKGGSES